MKFTGTQKIIIAALAILASICVCLAGFIIQDMLKTPGLPAHAADNVQATMDGDDPTLAPTQSSTDKIYSALVDRLDADIIRAVQLSGRDLIIQTNLTRADIQWFYEDIGTIHGIVVKADPDVDRVILDDITGQRIIIPMAAMRSFYQKSIDWDTFRSEWIVINR